MYPDDKDEIRRCFVDCELIVKKNFQQKRLILLWE